MNNFYTMVMRKHFVLLTALLLTNMLAFSQVMYDNFEYERRAHYEFVHGVLDEYAANPAPGGTNNSEVCGSYIRNAAEQFDVLVILPDGLMDDVSDYVNGTKTMTVDVYSPAAGIPVQITLEDSALAGPFNFPTGRHSVYLDTTTVANQWETLTLQYDSRPDPTVSNTAVTSVILLFNPGTNTADTYYFDNLRCPEFADPCASVTPAPLMEFEDFDCQRNLIYEYSDGVVNKRLNPATGGINSSKYAAEYMRNPDVDGTDVIVSRFAGNLDLTTDNQVKMMVYGDTATVKISLQDDTLEILAAEAQITQANTWQELTFDFSAITNYTGIDHAVILFDPGDVNPGIFWWDKFHLDGFVMASAEAPNPAGLAFDGFFPNPSNGLSTLSFELQKPSDVTVNISDLRGRRLRVPFEGRLTKGEHNLSVPTSGLAPGLYFWTLEAQGYRQSGKFVVAE